MNEITYIEKYLNVDSNTLNTLKNDIEWWERTGARYEYFMSMNDLSYTYGSGRGIRTYSSKLFHPLVKYVMMKLNDEFNTEYDICFLNRYDNEKMALGWHSDDSPEIDLDHPIAVVSIGAEREIWVKEIGFKGNIPDENKYLLRNGSLFVMPAGYQRTNVHKIPKSDRPCSTRISLTFRKYSGN